MSNRQNLLDVSFDIGFVTNPGKIRKNNEDALLVLPKHGCFAVSDGMGGGEAGEIASQMAVKSTEQKINVSGTSPAARERSVIQAAYGVNAEIGNFCMERGYESMGATLACFLLDSWDSNFATIFHAGDSRIYRWRKNVLECLTRDHTLAETGDIPESELPKEQRGVLTNVLGISSDFFLERSCCNVLQGDIFLICSDGLYRMVADEDLQKIIAQAENVSCAVISQLLLSEALNNGGHDNISIILVKIARIGNKYIPEDWEIQEEMFIQEQNIDDLSDTLPTGASE